MKYQQLVVNGCSYMHAYMIGGGHNDLAKLLNINNAINLAVSGSANARIIRTTLKHSYLTTKPTFYLVGITFIRRDDLPILEVTDEFEGRWTNPQNQDFADRWQFNWKQQDTVDYVRLKEKWEVFAAEDQLEDLQYRLITMVNDLKSRGHAVLVYQQADDVYRQFVDSEKFKLLAESKNIIDSLAWRAVPWQHEQGVPGTDYWGDAKRLSQVPPELVHPKDGCHQALNDFLVKYIKENKILE
jgi:hypothetical protein